MKEDILALVTIVISNAATWFFTRRKYQEEVASQEILNLNSTFNFYKTIIADLERRVTDLNTKLDEMQKVILKLEVENKELRKQLRKNGL